MRPFRGVDTSQQRFTAKAYQELFMRRMQAWAEQNMNSTLGHMSEAEIREMFREVAEGIRIDCKLDQETHEYMLSMVEKAYFSAEKKQWTKL